jgi:hypothetical protein
MGRQCMFESARYNLELLGAVLMQQSGAIRLLAEAIDMPFRFSRFVSGTKACQSVESYTITNG